MSADVWFYWVIVPFIKIAIALAVLPIAVALITWLERKLIAFIQVRIGPRRVGPHGLLQPFADVFKLLFKEDIVPSGANRMLFILAPILSVVPAFVVVAAYPMGPSVSGWADQWYFGWLVPIAGALGASLDQPLPLAITEIDIGLLFIVALSSLGVMSILIAGWSSNSKYPLLGGLRSAAQLISYEIPLGFALIAGLMMTGTMSMTGIVEAQRELGWSLAWMQPISLVIYFIAGVAETNRVPFDLPEAETELVSGFHTEYSGMKFAFFFLAEYINMITVTVIAVAVFLGGWLPPFHGILSALLAPDNPIYRLAFHPLLGIGWLIGKVFVVYLLYFWLRATLPRYRYDQLMDLGWKWLIPVSMLNVLFIGVNVVLSESLALPSVGLVAMAMMNVFALLLVVHVVRALKGRHGAQTV